MMSYQYEDQLDIVAKARYQAKIKTIGLDICPYKLANDRFTDDPTQWPNLQYGDIYNYLIDSPGIYTRETMKNYKSLDGYRFFVSGWVNKVTFCKVEGNFLFRCEVKPSYRVTCTPHSPWVALSSDGSVICAHCNCMAGLGETCSHVAAMLFKIEGAVRLGLNELACTELPCKWNNYFVKKITGKPLSQVDMFSDKVKINLKCSLRKRKSMPEEASDEDQKFLLGQLKECDTPPLCLSLFEETNKVFCQNKIISQPITSPPSLPQCLSSLYSPTPIQNLAAKIEEIIQSMKVTEVQQCQINDATKDQSKSIEWHSIRTGRITSSIVHQLLHTSSNNPCKSVIKSICYPKMFTTEATKWGKDHEKDGLDAFSEVFSTYHSDIEMHNCGLFLMQDASYIGASPDAIAICSCHGKSVVEVKCPFSYKQKSLEHYHITAGHKYYSQIQLQMMATGTETGYFVVWTPETSFVQTIERDESYQSSMFIKCQNFWKDHILPELLTRKSLSLDSVQNSAQVLCPNSATISEASASTTCISNSTAISQVSATATNSSTMSNASTSALNINCDQSQIVRMYCYCNGTGSGDMIGCDNPYCPYQWVHLKCASVKKVPKGKWYCKDCRVKK